MSAPRLTAAQLRALAVLAETAVDESHRGYARRDNCQRLNGYRPNTFYALVRRALITARRDGGWIWSITERGRAALAAYSTKETPDAD